MTRLHPNRLLAAHGVTLAAGTVASEAADARDQRPDSPVAAEYPTMITIKGGFTRIPIGSAVTIPTGQAAWYPLVRLELGNGGRPGLAVFGLTLTMTSPDIQGSGGGLAGTSTPLAWGNKQGEGAAVVLGTDLPTKVGQWAAGPCQEPGVVASGNGLYNATSRSNEIWAATFPPGAYSDPVPVKWIIAPSFQPYVVRFTPGRRLEVALAINGSTISGISSRNLYGYASVQLHVGLPETVRNPFPHLAKR